MNIVEQSSSELSDYRTPSSYRFSQVAGENEDGESGRRRQCDAISFAPRCSLPGMLVGFRIDAKRSFVRSFVRKVLRKFPY